MADTPQLISGAQLEAFTGLSDRRHRQLAKLGYFASPVIGQYRQIETIRGIFKYYREDRFAEAKTMHEAKLKKLSAEAAMSEIKLAEARGELASISDTCDQLAVISAKFDQLITQKLDIEAPARLVGKDIVAARNECRMIHDEMRETIRAGMSIYETPHVRP